VVHILTKSHVKIYVGKERKLTWQCLKFIKQFYNFIFVPSFVYIFTYSSDKTVCFWYVRGLNKFVSPLFISVASSSGHKVDLTATDNLQKYTVDTFMLDNKRVFLGEHDYIMVIKAQNRFQIGQMITIEVEALHSTLLQLNMIITCMFRRIKVHIVWWSLSSCCLCQCFIHSICSSTAILVEALLLYTNIDQTLVNSLQGLLNCEIGGLDCHVIKTEYKTHVQCIHMYHLFCNALVHAIYSIVSGQWLYTILAVLFIYWDSTTCCIVYRLRHYYLLYCL